MPLKENSLYVTLKNDKPFHPFSDIILEIGSLISAKQCARYFKGISEYMWFALSRKLETMKE